MIVSQAQSIKRIITCQGSAQLVTVLAVLAHRDTECGAISSENYLVIYDLYAPEGQNEAFAAFIQKMAEAVYSWQRIVYLTADTMQMIADQLESTAPAQIYQLVRDWVGVEKADEIYLCRNWQFGNQLLLNVYQTATKICYGDSIGVYFSANSAVVSPGQIQPPEPLSLSSKLKQQVKAGLAQMRRSLSPRTVLHSINFDQGYFVAPEIFGETPPMSTIKVSPTNTLTILRQLKTLVPPDIIAQFQAEIIDAPIAILLTSNLSEARRLSQTNEIQAYRSFLRAQAMPPNTVLVIKPHPRDDIAKIDALKDVLKEQFGKVVILTDPHLFFLPFEVFFLAGFSSVSREIKVFAVSSACLSFKLLFNLPSYIGFGKDLTSQWFEPSHMAARLEHEQILNSALSRLTPTLSVDS